MKNVLAVAVSLLVSLPSRLRTIVPALVVTLVAASNAMAEENTNATSTGNSVQTAFDAMGFDPLAFVSGLLTTFGPILVILFGVGAAIVMGKKAVKHFSRAT